jgi:1-acyl-sn-glycerol-3-phosphate acyltransferase
VSALYSFGKVAIAPVLRAVCRPTVSGLDHVPSCGPVILASNHLSVMDSILLSVVVPRQIYFLAKNEYFRRAPMRALMHGLNQIPVDRSGGRASLMALDVALPALHAGQALGIFPEGTRSPDGRLYRGRPGVAKLALDAGAPIVPVGLIGTERIQPIGARMPRIGPRAEVRIGKPLNLSNWPGTPADSTALREITAYLMAEIRALTGQEYVSRYAPRRLAGSPSPPPPPPPSPPPSPSI